jgi:phosphoribosylformylglycinamidine synthase
MAQLVEAVEGIAEACTHFEAPITGGNVSLYNETLGEGIYPTPVLGVVGLLKTAAPVPSRFPRTGAQLVLVGGFGKTDAQRFGSSQYAKVILDELWGLPPALDMVYEKRVHEAMREIAAAGIAESAHDLSDGGLAVALSECCTPEVGAKAMVPGGERVEFALFGEAQSRILVSTGAPEQVQEILFRHQVQGGVIGVTIGERLQIEDSGKMLIDVPTQTLRDTYEGALPEVLHSQHAG